VPFPQPDAIWRGDICGVAEQTQICWYLHLSQQLGRRREGRSLVCWLMPLLTAVDFWEKHSLSSWLLLWPIMLECVAARYLPPSSSFSFPQADILLKSNFTQITTQTLPSAGNFPRRMFSASPTLKLPKSDLKNPHKLNSICSWAEAEISNKIRCNQWLKQKGQLQTSRILHLSWKNKATRSVYPGVGVQAILLPQFTASGRVALDHGQAVWQQSSGRWVLGPLCLHLTCQDKRQAQWVAGFPFSDEANLSQKGSKQSN